MNRLHTLPLFFLLVVLLSACTRRPVANLDDMLALADSIPDSVLSTLQKENPEHFNDEDMAKYCLAYAWAQQKKFLFIDNDSLIRHAYIYYLDRNEDPFYARCMYYMGSYYYCSDSVEKAENCFTLAAVSAERHQDYKLRYMALELLTRLMRLRNPEKAVENAEGAIEAYNMYPKKNIGNYILLLLNVGNALQSAKRFEESEAKMREALGLAYAINDSVKISCCYQDLSAMFQDKLAVDSALSAARMAYRYAPNPDYSLKFALTGALILSNDLDEADSLLNTIETTTEYLQYYALYNRLLIDIRKGNVEKSVASADSAINRLEKMFNDEIDEKCKYYEEILSVEHEKQEAERSSKTRGIALVAAISLSLLLAYIYVSYKKTSAMKLRNEQETNRLKLEHEQEMHKKEMENREAQIKIMRDYLLTKISITGKIEKLNDGSSSRKILEPADWKELEVFLNSVDSMFVSRMREQYPDLQEKDLQLFMLLRLKISAKSLASIYCITEKAVKQKLFLYKEKVGLGGEKTSLRAFVEAY
ncbi:MAG: hypothetical protein HUK08_00070 [Bacteroidaceae bacterium]|nr:hypothetical protein [Bacteroidaceae bacterium]